MGFPDGTGCCYYPSGHVAVMITSTEKGKYTYIVQTNKGYQDLEDSGLLAIFQANGNSICYYKRNQKIRTYINAFGGVELDPKGRKKKRWQWYMIKGHVHTPPFHPLCFSLNKYLSVRILNQQNIALSFSSLRRSVRFNVGAQLKALSVRNRSLFGADDPAEIYLSETSEDCEYIDESSFGSPITEKSSGGSVSDNFTKEEREDAKVGDGSCPTPSYSRYETVSGDQLIWSLWLLWFVKCLFYV